MVYTREIEKLDDLNVSEFQVLCVAINQAIDHMNMSKMPPIIKEREEIRGSYALGDGV